MPSRDYQLINCFFCLKWKCIVPLPYFFRSIPSSLTNNEEANEECFPCQRTGEALGSSPFSLRWQRAISKVKVPSNPSLVKKSGVLDRRVELRGFMHMTCSYIHDSCYLLYDICLMELIDKWYAMYVLAGPRLMISACVEGSAGKHNSNV